MATNNDNRQSFLYPLRDLYTSNRRKYDLLNLFPRVYIFMIKVNVLFLAPKTSKNYQIILMLRKRSCELILQRL
jgi:hypothetical protein